MPRKTKAVKEATEQFYQCPAGHRLPHRTDLGRCTALYCAGYQKRVKENGKVTKVRQAEIQTLLAPEPVEDVQTEEKAAITRMDSRRMARREYFGAPTKLQGADAEEWGDKKLVELVPEAVAELEYQLKLGDDEQRFRAAKQVLDSTGRGKREVGAGGSSPIIMLVGAGPGPVQAPWVQRVEPDKLPSDGGKQ
jgi:hypothetical protein